jgi:alpha-amylase
VTKSLSLLPGSQVLSARCQIFNRADSPVRLWFGNEWIFSLLAGDAPDRYYHFEGAVPEDVKLASRGIVPGVRRMMLRDEWLGLSIVLTWNKPATVWRLPLETVSLSEAGFERIYQASVVLPNWKIALAPGARWSVSLSITFNQQVNS